MRTHRSSRDGIRPQSPQVLVIWTLLPPKHAVPACVWSAVRRTAGRHSYEARHFHPHIRIISLFHYTIQAPLHPRMPYPGKLQLPDLVEPAARFPSSDRTGLGSTRPGSAHQSRPPSRKIWPRFLLHLPPTHPMPPLFSLPLGASGGGGSQGEAK